MPTLGVPHSRGPQHSGWYFISQQVIVVPHFAPTDKSSSYTHYVRATALTTAREARFDNASLDNAVEQYFSQGLASATRKVYTAGIQKFIELCNQLHGTLSPTPKQLLCKFVSYLALNSIPLQKHLSIFGSSTSATHSAGSLNGQHWSNTKYPSSS